MKVNLRLDSGEDADPASSALLDELLSAAGDVFAAALEELVPAEALPPEAEISITFLSSEEMREQNMLYRGIDEPTDVLSFPLWEEEGRFAPEAGMPVLPLGDIVICPAYVRNNLPSCRTFREEAALMLAHGFLHLLGRNHASDSDRRAMEEDQERLSRALLERSGAGRTAN
ncbi:MAG: rRNA maturation RNase YbeY [Synergistaceae bacterium]|nr:rRNA maturation RNase YbeY [Synergistaceae bacterium]